MVSGSGLEFRQLGANVDLAGPDSHPSRTRARVGRSLLRGILGSFKDDQGSFGIVGPL